MIIILQQSMQLVSSPIRVMCRQALLGFGHVLYLIYTLHYGLWPLYVTQFTDLFFIIIMVVLKVYYDRKSPAITKSQDPASQSQQGKHPSPLLKNESKKGKSQWYPLKTTQRYSLH